MTQATELLPILDAHYRANPAYSLVLFDRLPEALQEQLKAMLEDEEFYGVIQSNNGNNPVTKAVDQETALLFLTLQDAGPIPEYVRRKFDRDCNQAIAELVLEGILEMTVNGSQEFASGGAAHSWLFREKDQSFESQNRLVQLSYNALNYGQQLPQVNASDLAMRLYRYNTIPLSPSWRDRWDNWESTAKLLRIHEIGPLSATIERHWRSSTPADEETGWLSWHKTDQSRSPRTQTRLPYKLYISPMPAALPDVWPVILDQMTHSEVASFKIGNDLSGLLRPDKIVAYLPDFASVAAAAKGLQAALKDCPAQGVPFSAPIDDQGLLSWGMDPNKKQSAFDSQGSESWRAWITKQLAGALVEAREGAAGIEPRQFALDRLRLQGIDTETWVPKQSMWQNAGSFDDDNT
jgi:hypothetical protein